ncbi:MULTISPECIES: P27 family phage terminase small subunit [Heyndrickxia]|uniref:P27 family phage terminase small subunit n=1 Tax=Heyndrickxia TaxID=2837504 RepID=UPI00242B9965|nr:P27 family phage terminase small subunit [Heyndrickxia oleronia]MCI1592477.1 P27 family phage terminase small subunit [Heyndrickxia oleronia]MCI1615438.1 P27 family phage terminase small subunit [Heyndrickxia oleronia]MCI1746292.1 P27 family phage terminase small subunit [Heyndrickxia oleronia]MCI1763595.1 P27 family phage terminase small subunit [Heyndrickxia oleronia]
MSTKKERQKIVAEKTEIEKQRILKIMRDADLYTLTLDPLIESYLDIYEIYMTMYIQWKEKGFPATQRHTNKAGATNNSKHPLAQQVETWADKKTKALDLLGLTNKSKPGKIVTGGSSVRKDEELKKPEQPKVDELAAHRNKWRNAT